MSSKKGFTVLELAMIAGIVVVLLGVVIPAVNGFLQKARETSDKQTLTVLNDALNRYKIQGGDIGALTVGTPYANMLSHLRTPVDWYGTPLQFLANSGPYDNAITIEAKGSGKQYSITRYNTYTQGAGTGVLADGEDITNPEFNIAGATYYAVAEAGYSYSSLQDSKYGARKYNTLGSAEAALPTDPTTPMVINILGSWSSAQPGLTFEGPNTTASNYLLVRALGDARHSGVWSSTAFHLSGVVAIGTKVGHMVIDGLQLSTNRAADYAFAIQMTHTIEQTLDVYNCLVRDLNNAYSSHHGLASMYQPSVVHTIRVYNSIFYDFSSSGIYNQPGNGGSSITVYNSTFVDCGTGVAQGSSGTLTAYNCLAQGGFEGFNSAVGGDYNITEMGTPPGANSSIATVSFVNAGADNFHLDAGDTVARGTGADYSGLFSTDIDGDARTAPWSVGADQ